MACLSMIYLLNIAMFNGYVKIEHIVMRETQKLIIMWETLAAMNYCTVWGVFKLPKKLANAALGLPRPVPIWGAGEIPSTSWAFNLQDRPKKCGNPREEIQILWFLMMFRISLAITVIEGYTGIPKYHKISVLLLVIHPMHFHQLSITSSHKISWNIPIWAASKAWLRTGVRANARSRFNQLAELILTNINNKQTS